MITFGTQSTIADENEVPAPEPELTDFDAEIEPSTDEDGNIQTSSGQIIYDVTLIAESHPNQLPQLYPFNINYYENGNSVGNEVVYMTPTQSTSYIPQIQDDEEYMLTTEFKTIFQFDQDSTQSQDIEFKIESRHTDDELIIEDNPTVEGESPAGITTDSETIIERTLRGEPSETSAVSRYRINDTEESSLEDLTIPAPEDDLSGEIDDFSNIRSTDNSATIEAEDDGFNMVTRTNRLPNDEPQTITIGYKLIDGDMEIIPISPNGSEIDPNTTYELPEDPSEVDECTEGDQYNLCVYTVSQEETDNINNMGELYLNYKGDSNITGELMCESTITGYTTINSTSCGDLDIEPTPDVSINSFDARENEETEWESPIVEVGENENVDFRTIVNSNIQEDNELKSVIYDEDDIDSSGSTADAEPIVEETFTMSDSSEEITSIDEEIDFDSNFNNYMVFICEEDENDCDLTNNLDSEDLTIQIEGSGGDPPDLVIDDPIGVKLDYTEEEVRTGTRIEEVMDSNLDESRDNDNWENEGIVNEDFTGEQTETIRFESVTSSSTDIDVLEEYANIAEDKRSNIGNNEWIGNELDIEGLTDYNISYTVEDVHYAGEDAFEDGSDGFTKVDGPIREAEIPDEYEEEYFRTIESENNISSPDTGWFIDRNADDLLQETTAELEVIEQHENPSDCLNCLPAETIDEAIDRLGEDNIIETEDGIWEKKGEAEPDDFVEITEADDRYEEFYYDPGESWTLVFETDDSSEPDVYRTTESESISVYEWVREQNVNEVKHNRPVTDNVYKWEERKYDIEFEFTSDLENEDLYRWEKPTYSTTTNYEPEIEYFDLSDSSPNDGEIDSYSINLKGDNNVVVDWKNEIHLQAPEDRSCSQLGDNYSENTVEFGMTETGQGFVDICESDDTDETQIIRVGQYYTDPGEFEHDITMTSEDGDSTTETALVDVRGEDKPANIPEVDFDVNAINEQIDYNSENAVFDIDIESDTDYVEDDWWISVEPADEFSTQETCISGFEETTEYEFIRESDTSQVDREIVNCEAMEETDEDDFQLKEREVRTEFTEVEGGVYDTCEDIPTHSEEGTHSGYQSEELDDGEVNCVLQDTDDPGPTGFEFITQEQTVNGEELQYQDLPRGSVRECSGTLIEENESYKCEYDDETIEFANIDEGNWSINSTNLDIDSYETSQIVWNENNVYESNEQRTVHVNPRANSKIQPTGEDSSQEFTFTLESDNDNISEKEETVDVQLCEAQQGSSILKTQQGSNECSEFDTIFNDIPDMHENGEPLIPNNEFDETYVSLNDVCPYTQKFPRSSDELEPIDISHLDTVSDVETYVENELRSHYAGINDPCGSEGDESENYDLTLKAYDYETEEPINATYTVDENTQEGEETTFTLPEGEHDVEIAATGYETETFTQNIESDITQEVYLTEDSEETGPYDIDINLIDEDSNELIDENDNPIVELELQEDDENIELEGNEVNYEDIDSQDINIIANADDYYEKESMLNLNSDTELNIELEEEEGDDRSSRGSSGSEITEDEPDLVYNVDVMDLEGPEEQRNTRIVTNEHLSHIDDNSVQSEYSEQGDQRGLRLGYPVMNNPKYEDEDGEEFGLNSNLIAHYPLDHNPDIQPVGDYWNEQNNYKIQDAFVPLTDNLESYTDISEGSYNKSDQVFNGIFWYGADCVDDPISSRNNNEFCNELYTDKDKLTSDQAKEIIENNEYRYIQGYERTEEGVDEIIEDISIIGNEANYLPVPADRQILEHDENETDEILEQENNVYTSDGIFGGSAFNLDQSAFILLSPNCEVDDSDWIEEGGESLWEICESSGDLEDVNEPSSPASGGGEGAKYNSLSSEISDMENGYTISFWYNPDNTNTDEINRNSESILSISNDIDTNSGDPDNNNWYDDIHTSFQLNQLENVRDECDSDSVDTIIGWQANCPSHSDSEFGDDPQQDNENLYSQFEHRNRILNDNWNHIAVTYEGGLLNTWKNGELIETSTFINNSIYLPQYNFKDTYGDADSLTGESDNLHEIFEDGSNDPKISDIDYWDTSYDIGNIHPESSISLGGKFYAPYDDGIPMFETPSEGKIDEIRVYDKALRPEMIGELSYQDINHASFRDETGQFDDIEYSIDSKSGSGLDSTYKGEFRSDKIKLSDVEVINNIEQEKEYLSQENEYRININGSLGDPFEANNIYMDVIPCNENNCNEDNSESVSVKQENDLEDNIIRFDDIEFEEYDSLQFDFELESFNIEVSPIIENIEIETSPNFSYESCEAFREENSGVSGTTQEVSILNEEKDNSFDRLCEFETEGESWQLFNWVEENTREGMETSNKDIKESECGLNQANCFGEAELPDKEDTKIMVKAIDDNEIVDRGIYNLNSEQNQQFYEEAEESEIVQEIYDYFTMNISPDGTELNITDDNYGIHVLGPSSSDYDGEKANRVEHLIEEEHNLTIPHVFNVIDENQEDYHMRINTQEVTDEDDYFVTDVQCLGQDVDSCEFYYTDNSD